MIITYAYPGPFFDDHVELRSSDGKSNSIPTRPDAFFEFKPRGEGPWSLTIGSSTAVAEIEEADSVVVYAGQKNTVTTNGL